MPLSERERQILDEIERSFLRDDLASTASGRLRRTRRLSRAATLAIAVIGVLIGLGCGVLGVVTGGTGGVSLAVFGFVVVVAICTALMVARRRGRA
jgi:hypothetical protein